MRHLRQMHQIQQTCHIRQTHHICQIRHIQQTRCGTCHMAYILIFSIFLPSLNNTILIFSSYFIKHTLASFFKFLCICATESLPGIYKAPELSQIIQSSTCSCPDNTSSSLASTCCLLLDAHPQMRRGRFCCVSSKWPQASWSQVSLGLLCPCHQEAQFPSASQPCQALSVPPRSTVPDRKSALPCSVRAITRHQTLIASQHRHLLDSIVFTLDWCSYCMPQAGTVTKSYCTSLAGTLTNRYCTPQAGTVTKSYCTPLAGTLTNSYCTAQAGTVTKSYCMPQAGTLMNSYFTPQAGTVSLSPTITVRHKLVLQPIKKPGFVFLFCHPNKGHSVLCNLLLKEK